MKQEQVIELAKQAGFPFNKYGLLQGDEEGEIEADEMFTRFASLVEQATLERAAKACEQVEATYERVASARGGAWDEYHLSKSIECSEKIRNLAKDAQ
ncbi:MAG: hypothetical protein [Bacteriophage sp.]|nr:MAG: hypothetical protein [Bacteriophage sp.]